MSGNLSKARPFGLIHAMLTLVLCTAPSEISLHGKGMWPLEIVCTHEVLNLGL